MSSTPRARALTAELKKARNAKKLTVRQLATLMGWSHARVSRIENAKQGIEEADVSALLTKLEVPAEDRERLLKMTRDLDEPAWWEVHQGVSSQLAALIDAEQRAERITYVTPTLIPGLLQTRAYTRAVYEAAELPPRQMDDAIGVRQSRQGVVEKSDPVELVAYLDETVLERPTGGSGVAADQLRHLLKAGERSNVNIRVVPLRLGAHTGLDGMFSLIELPRGEATVHIEAPNAGVLLSEWDDVQPFTQTVDSLDKAALSTDDSLELVSRYATQHEEA